MIQSQSSDHGSPEAGLLTPFAKKSYVREQEQRQQKLTYASYVLLAVCQGALETIGASLYNQFESQLNASGTHVAFILSVKAISSAVSAVIIAIILQYVHNSHRYVVIFSIITAFTVSAMAYVQTISLMFLVFVMVGYYLGICFVSYPVYIFRLYPENQSRALFTCMVIYGLSKSGFPLLINLSLELFNSYAPSMFVLAFCLVLVSILLCYLPTPKHDSLRSLNDSMSNKQRLSTTHEQKLYIKEQLKTNPSIRYYTRLFLLFINFLMFGFSAFQSGTINFIQKYVSQDLGFSANTGRYLISCYYFGQLLYRLIASVLFKEINPIKSIMSSIVVLIVVAVVFGVLTFGHDVGWVSMPDDKGYAAVLYIIYINIGVWASPIFPGIFKWTESVKTVSGLLSGVLMVFFSVGDASMVFLVGMLIKYYGIRVMPLPIIGYMFFCLCISVVTMCIFNRFAAIRNEIINSIAP